MVILGDTRFCVVFDFRRVGFGGGEVTWVDSSIAIVGAMSLRSMCMNVSKESTFK